MFPVLALFSFGLNRFSFNKSIGTAKRVPNAPIREKFFEITQKGPVFKVEKKFYGSPVKSS